MTYIIIGFILGLLGVWGGYFWTKDNSPRQGGLT